MQDIILNLTAPVALFLAVLLGASAAHKVIDRPRMATAISELTGTSLALAPPILAAVIALEAVTALLLILPDSAAIGAFLAALIWLTYLSFIVMAIARGRRDLDCGCSFGRHHAPLGQYEIIRNLILVTLAGIVIAAPPVGGLLISASALLSALAFATLYTAAEQISALRVFRTVRNGE